jgi:hypothetical protein
MTTKPSTFHTDHIDTTGLYGLIVALLMNSKATSDASC